MGGIGGIYDASLSILPFTSPQSLSHVIPPTFRLLLVSFPSTLALRTWEKRAGVGGESGTVPSSSPFQLSPDTPETPLPLSLPGMSSLAFIPSKL